MNQNSILYNSRQFTLAYTGYKDYTHFTYGQTYVLPVEFIAQPKYILGGSLRLGLTIWNTISIFAKAND